MTDIGELVVRIKADATQLEREMGKANAVVRQSTGGMETAFRGLKSQILTLAPALSAVAFVEFGRRAIEAVGHINDLAQRTGFAASTLSALEPALKASGSGLDDFSASINRMNNLVGEAAKGINLDAIKSFDALGLSVRKLQQMTPEEQFYQIAAALGAMESQSEMTNAGMAIFGRGFASIIPLIKEANGDLEESVQKLKDTNDALGQETIDRIDAFGDALGNAAIKARNAFAEAFAWILKVSDKAAEFANDSPAAKMYREKGILIGGYQPPDGEWGGSGGTYDPAWGGSGGSASSKSSGPHTGGRITPDTSAMGSNADLLNRKDVEAQAKKYADAKKTLDEYNESLLRQNNILQQTPREQAALEAGYKTMDLARKAGIKDAGDMIAANDNLARTNYDLALSMQEAARFQQELHDKLSATLTDIAFKADSASESMLAFAESIARAAFEKRVAGPIADALIGSGGGRGLLDDAIDGIGELFGGFFADGGDPPVGLPSIVGERGPEIFVPKTAGTIVPNHAMGGTQSLQVVNHWHVSPGVEETVEIGLRRAAPSIVSQSVAAVMQAAQQGGAASRIFGKRS